MPADKWYSNRVTENLRREILWVISNKVSDPRLPSMVTVPSISLARDTRNATVYISVLGTDEEKKVAVEVLNHAAPFIQKSVSSRVKIKNFPRFFFKIDEAFEKRNSIESLLEQVKDDLERPTETD